MEPPFPQDLEGVRKLAEKGIPIIFGSCAVHSLKNFYWVIVQGNLNDKVLMMLECPLCRPTGKRYNREIWG